MTDRSEPVPDDTGPEPISPSRPTPHEEYRRRLSESEQEVCRQSRLDAAFSTARGVVFLAGVALLIFDWPVDSIRWPLAVAVWLGFVGSIAAHNTFHAKLSRARRRVSLYQTNLQRLVGDYRDPNPSGLEYLDPNHPYAGDLDIFGDGSLFQHLDRTRTRPGAQTLANWLLTPVNTDEALSRQAAVRWLQDQLDLREQLALLQVDVTQSVGESRLPDWGLEPAERLSFPYLLTARLLGLATTISIVGYLFGNVRLSVLLICVLAQTAVLLAARNQILRSQDEADRILPGLKMLSRVLHVIETAELTEPRVRALQDRLRVNGILASQQIGRLYGHIVSLQTQLRSQAFAPIAWMLSLPVSRVHAIETWRARVGQHVPDWLASLGEFEALCSLAAFAYEHTECHFPEISAGSPKFHAEQIAHPLLPNASAIRNDVTLDARHRLIVISGSNMSGKSTLLRTVGVNTVLALAGAPVRARSLQLSPMQVATAMRVRDSLQAGASLFYTAVARLAEVIRFTVGAFPVLFLLDEILQGTNSHDRRLGAESIIRSLVDAGAIGLVTTHDLALTNIVDRIGETARNAHFEDRLEDGQMLFDYQMRDGVVAHSNALALMQMLGIEVTGNGGSVESRPAEVDSSAEEDSLR